jgi:sugar phosphate isomerase/epimerase
LLTDRRLEISNLNAFTMYAVGDVYNPSWIDPSSDKRAQRLKHTVDCIRLAEMLGARNISTEPGGEFKEGMNRSALEREFTKGIMEASRAAEKSHVEILIEPEPGLLIENSSQFLKIIRDMPSNVRLNFDIGHFFCVREDPAKLVSLLADYISHFHLEDIASSRVHAHLIPGHGAIDFGSIFRAMKEIGYRGFVTVELYPYQDSPSQAAAEAFAYINQVAS